MLSIILHFRFILCPLVPLATRQLLQKLCQQFRYPCRTCNPSIACHTSNSSNSRNSCDCLAKLLFDACAFYSSIVSHLCHEFAVKMSKSSDSSFSVKLCSWEYSRYHLHSLLLCYIFNPWVLDFFVLNYFTCGYHNQLHLEHYLYHPFKIHSIFRRIVLQIHLCPQIVFSLNVSFNIVIQSLSLHYFL